MLALSTAWASLPPSRLIEAVSRSVDAGFPFLTIDAIDPGMDVAAVADQIKLLRANVVAVSTLEALGLGTMPLKRASLSSPSAGEREEAMEQVGSTVSAGARLGTSSVVLEGGHVDVEGIHDLTRRIRKARLLHDPSDPADDDVAGWIDEVKRLIEAAQDPYIDGLCRSLHHLTRRFPDTRFHLVGASRPYGLPNLEQIQLVFSEVKHSNLRYWHDTASCHILERMGFDSHQQWLESLGDRTSGGYLHDYADLEAHGIPGRGEIDFTMVAFFLPKAASRSLWVSGSYHREDLAEGVSYLEKLGIL